MNKIYLLALAALALCAVETQGRTVGDFFNNLPDDVGNAFTSAWHNIKKAIKRPVRIKRLGRGGRRKKSSTIATTTTTTEAANISTTSPIGRVPLPVLPIPRWRSLHEWKNLQKPRFALKSGGPARRFESFDIDGAAKGNYSEDSFAYYLVNNMTTGL